MPTERKVETLALLTDKMRRQQLTVVTDYRGLTVAEITDLRKKLRDSGAELIVAKNTLVRMAANETGNQAIVPLLEGPTALAISYDDIAKTAKALNDYIRASKKSISVRGGLLGNDLLAADGLEAVSNLPSRQQIMASILGGVNAPASRIVGAMNGVMRNIAFILRAYSDKETAAAETAAS
jgi:large subunit ribosomal protein L10